MLPFLDRREAGKELAARLIHYEAHNEAVVIGLPRGGVVTGDEVAKALNLPLDIICPRKIGSPYDAEAAIGAITESGEPIFDEELMGLVEASEPYIQETIQQEKQEAQYRLSTYRKGRPPRVLTGRTVILVDDGLASGATMKAAIRTAKEEGAAKIVVGVPVAPAETLEAMESLVDEVVCCATPPNFFAIGQFYQEFAPTKDDEVMAILATY